METPWLSSIEVELELEPSYINFTAIGLYLDIDEWVTMGEWIKPQLDPETDQDS